MGILLSTLDRQIQASTESRTPGPADDFWYRDAPSTSDAGIQVTEQGALAISTVWKCVNWYFKMFGTLPKKLFERTTLLGRPAQVEARTHPLFSLIHSAPNPTMTSAYWFGLIAADLKLWGNSYAAIQRNENSGKIKYLWRITPDASRPAMVRDANNRNQLWYFIRGDNGLEVKFYPDEILHIRGLGFDGVQGYSPIRMQMNLLGWNRATVRYGGQFFKKASRPSGIVATPNPLGDKKQGVIDGLSATGTEAGKLVLIEGAVTYHKLTMDQDEAQFLGTMEFQEEDIAGMMDVKPHEIGIMRRATNNNIEQETISSTTRNLTPFSVNVEQWCDLQLLSDAPSSGIGGGTERERFFMQTEMKGLLRGDTAAQTAHIAQMINSGVYSQNDSLDYLGKPPFEGGDRRWINAAYIPLDMAEEILTQRNPPPSAEPAPDDSASVNQNPLVAEVQARLERSYIHVFRDAAGRVTSKKKSDRERFAPAIFEHVMSTLIAGLGAEPDDVFAQDYLSALAKRAANWEEATANETAAVELRRAVAAILERTGLNA